MSHKISRTDHYFNPGFKRDSFVFVGSQSLNIWNNIPEEQAMEGFYLAAAFGNNIGVVRNIDPLYIDYWKSLTENSTIINLPNIDPGKYLSQVITENTDIVETIKKNILPSSHLMVFLITEYEEKLSEILQIPLHGSLKISNSYGTKSGIRELVKGSTIRMPPGYVCADLQEIYEAVEELQKKFDSIVIKHDMSVSGYLTKKIDIKNLKNIKKVIQDFFVNDFGAQKGNYVVEGWIKSKSSLCAHIEILEDRRPIICAGWQQLIANDGISYMGSTSLQLSPKAFLSFYEQLKTLANLLVQHGAIGSFGPDFLIVSDEENNVEPDTAVLVELNARVPYTAFPIELIKHTRGFLGNSFISSHIKTKKNTSFAEIVEVLEKENVLITKRDTNATGVVPFNIGLLPWKTFDIAVMAESFEETKKILHKVQTIFE